MENLYSLYEKIFNLAGKDTDLLEKQCKLAHLDTDYCAYEKIHTAAFCLQQKLQYYDTYDVCDDDNSLQKIIEREHNILRYFVDFNSVSVDIDTSNRVECGLKQRLRKRVVGGGTVGIQEAPWQVALFIKRHLLKTCGNKPVIKNEDYFEAMKPSDSLIYVDSFFCGGSILNEFFVLSAAHCGMSDEDMSTGGVDKFKNVMHPPIYVTYNYHNIQDSTNNYYKWSPVERMFYHPDNTGPLGDMGSSYGGIRLNDLMLIKVQNRLDFSGAARPACLPKAPVEVNELCQITGFGSTSFFDGDYEDLQANLPYRLYKAETRVMEKEKCTEYYKNVQLVEFISETEVRNVTLLRNPKQKLIQEFIRFWLDKYMNEFNEKSICVGSRNDQGLFTPATAKGDSGGPLSCPSSDGKNMVLQGVTSFGWYTTPGVFAAVYPNIDWIKQYTTDLQFK